MPTLDRAYDRVCPIQRGVLRQEEAGWAEGRGRQMRLQLGRTDVALLVGPLADGRIVGYYYDG